MSAVRLHRPVELCLAIWYVLDPFHQTRLQGAACVQSPAQETAALMTRSIRQEMQSLKDQLDQAQSNEVGSMVGVTLLIVVCRRPQGESSSS